MADNHDAALPGTTTFSLHDAPDTAIGGPEEATKAVQVFQIELARDLVKEMQQHAKSSKGIQLSFGRTPMLRYGTTSKPLHITPSTYRNELYRKDSDESQDMSFVGLVSHNITMKKVEETTAGADAAMAALKAQMASYSKDKEANQMKVDKDVRPLKNNKKLIKTTSHLSIPDFTKSLPSSPAIHTTTFASAAATQFKAKAQRLTILHLLAIGPTSEATIIKKTAIPKTECVPLLEKFAKQTGSGYWQLGEKWFKELDLWQFPYPSQEDRQAAIDNAIRAYDRQRLSREDKLWQLLLPKDERGKGKILSKLSMNNGSTPTPQPATSTSGSIGATSDSSDLKHLGVESMVRSVSQEPVRPKKTSEKEAMSKRLFSKKTQQPIRAPKVIAKKEDNDEKSKITKGTKVTTESTVVKPGLKRKIEPKIKSAEFVDDSDDNEDDAVTAPAAKRVKTENLPVKASPQQRTVTSKAGHDAGRTSTPKGVSVNRVPALKPLPTPATTATPKAQTGPAKSITPSGMTKLPKDAPDRVKIRAPVARPILSPVVKAEATGKVVKPNTSAATQKKTGPEDTQTQNQKPTQVPTQPPAPASSSSASSSTWFSSLKSTSHRHSSSQSSLSSSASGDNRPVIQKRMVPVKSVKSIPSAAGTLPKKRKIDSSAAKPSSLGVSPPVNASDSEGPLSEHSQALSSVDSPAFAAVTPGPHVHMPDASSPISQVASNEDNPFGNGKLPSNSSAQRLPAKVLPVVRSPRAVSFTSLDDKRDAALDKFLAARMAADRAYPEGKPAAVRENLWIIHNEYSYLRREVETRQGGIDSTEPDLATLTKCVPKGSAAFFQNKIHEVWPIYSTMYDKLASLDTPSQAQVKELCQLNQEIKDLQMLYRAAFDKDRSTQLDMFTPLSNANEGSNVPLSCRQSFDMYAAFQRNLAAYASFQHELRALPAYPDLPQENLAQDAAMFARLSEMRKEIFEGFQEMIRVHNKRCTGVVRLSDFLIANKMPTEFEAELETWRMRNRFDKWMAEYRGVKNDFGHMKGPEMKALWEELGVIKVQERRLITAVALDFGSKEEAELGEVSLEEFEPLDGRKGLEKKK